MTLVVSQPQLSNKETSAVVELLCWCLNMGLDYIFMFDPNGYPPCAFVASYSPFLGILKEQSDAIVHRVREACPELCVSGTSGWTPIEKQTLPVHKRTAPFFLCAVLNGDVYPEKGTQIVHFLSRGDSLSPLLQAASYPEIQENKRQGYRGLDDVDQYWSTDLSMEMLRNEITAVFGDAAVLEPDIICVTGPVFSLAFCPPWHSRFSEIYYLGPLNTLRFSHFSATLGRFWQTHQRFGT